MQYILPVSACSPCQYRIAAALTSPSRQVTKLSSSRLAFFAFQAKSEMSVSSNRHLRQRAPVRTVVNVWRAFPATFTTCLPNWRRATSDGPSRPSPHTRVGVFHHAPKAASSSGADRYATLLARLKKDPVTWQWHTCLLSSSRATVENGASPAKCPAVVLPVLLYTNHVSSHAIEISPLGATALTPVVVFNKCCGSEIRCW